MIVADSDGKPSIVGPYQFYQFPFLAFDFEGLAFTRIRRFVPVRLQVFRMDSSHRGLR